MAIFTIIRKIKRYSKNGKGKYVTVLVTFKRPIEVMIMEKKLTQVKTQNTAKIKIYVFGNRQRIH